MPARKKYKVGAWVRIKSLVELDRENPDMQQYVGQTGTITTELPPEWEFETMFRVDFTDPTLTPKAFFRRELEIV
jgi:hypothetical protein